MKPVGLLKPKVVLTPKMKALLDTSKHESRLLGDIQRTLLGRKQGEGRASDVLHPSEICKEGWCQRAGYYNLIGAPRVKEARAPGWRMEMVWDEGHTIHDKWQNRMWDEGMLIGQFYCIACQKAWWDQSPEWCEDRLHDRPFLKYHEVPLYDGLYKIGGKADGIIPGALVELKTVGVGTVRIENPELLAKNTYKLNVNGKGREFVDLDQLWDDIRQPFPSHIRQGHIYDRMTGRGKEKDILGEEVFIYECKWNQKVKEFVVRYREERIAPILNSCRRIVESLESGIPPDCTFDLAGCPECKVYEPEQPTQTNRRRLQTGPRSYQQGSPEVRPARRKLRSS